MFRTKCVYSPITARRDGLRILATRFRGRGMPKDLYDVWMPNLGPSEKLLSSFLAGKLTWADFSRRYRAELFHSGSADSSNRTIKNHGQKFTLRLLQRLAQDSAITILCHCSEDQPHCHRHILETVLSRPI
jgi:uncharacterized protein YeaO (DUF488 family)